MLLFYVKDTGLVTGGTDAFGNSYKYERDTNGYITGSVSPDGTRTDYYKGGKLPSKITDANGNTVDYRYDEQGRAVSITDSFGAIGRVCAGDMSPTMKATS